PGGCSATGATWTWVGADPAESLHVSRLAGASGGGGWFDGSLETARFLNPWGIASDAAGNVYVLDGSWGLVRKVSPSGRVTTLAGLAGSYGGADGRGPIARFNNPDGIAASASGVVYVADTENHTIRRILPTGEVTLFAGAAGVADSADGSAGVARFFKPRGVVVDAAGTLYVADTSNHTIRKITPAGVVSTLAGEAQMPGTANGRGSAARFRSPQGVAVDGSGNVYVADTGNHTIRKITPAGDVTTLAGVAGLAGWGDGDAAFSVFRSPTALVVDGAGNVLVADTANMTVRLVSTSGVVSTLAGRGLSPGNADGAGADARFTRPSGIALEPGGTFVVSDSRSVRRMTATGVVSTVTGETDAPMVYVDGPGADARFPDPAALAADSHGNLFVADPLTDVIRKIAPSGETTTYAGVFHHCALIDGPLADARFCGPSGLVIDANDNIYVSDSWNNAIRKVTPDGVVTTLAGGSECGNCDGTGRAAGFDEPWGVTVDAAGNVWVADSANHTIRRITPSGVVTTVAGTAGYAGYVDGVGSSARFYSPAGIAADRHGNVYVADYSNARIRKVTGDGVVTTLLGPRDERPVGIQVDGSGNVFFGGHGSRAVFRMTPSGAVTPIAGGSGVGGAAEGTGSAALVSSVEGLALRPNGDLAFSNIPANSIWLGVPSLADTATIDATSGPVGQTRQLGVAPSTATSWHWELVRTESASTAALSATNVPNPTFTPDVPGLYRFRLTATDGVRKSMTIVSLHAGLPAPSVHVTGGGVYCPGDTVLVRAEITGIPPLTITWSDGEVWSDYREGSGTRTITATTPMAITVTSVTDAVGVTSVGTGGAVIDVTATRTPAPVVSAPAAVGAGSPNRTASVVSHPGSAYSWSISGGRITSGHDEAVVTFTAGDAGTLTLYAREQAPGECQSSAGTATVQVLPAGSAMRFYPVTPCRVLDTRDASGPTLGQPLAGDGTLGLNVAGMCGVSPTAKAVAANVTVTQPAGSGYIVVFPGDEAEPI
ncbi:MAG: SMP-30/gluconolactonase/LRE family protein, partial [Thermoanaerobaculia bacterium]|nr:SMP-30/gluconolactonase/LRE family protein [Thermoanaerobaculia bacterium]